MIRVDRSKMVDKADVEPVWTVVGTLIEAVCDVGAMARDSETDLGAMSSVSRCSSTGKGSCVRGIDGRVDNQRWTATQRREEFEMKQMP